MTEKKYDDTNRGALFKNDRKQQENHADYQGAVNVEGKDFYLNAWVREGKNGKYFSLSVKPKQPRRDGMDQSDPFSDSVPF
jgi:hypothetical protein